MWIHIHNRLQFLHLFNGGKILVLGNHVDVGMETGLAIDIHADISFMTKGAWVNSNVSKVDENNLSSMGTFIFKVKIRPEAESGTCIGEGNGCKETMKTLFLQPTLQSNRLPVKMNGLGNLFKEIVEIEGVQQKRGKNCALPLGVQNVRGSCQLHAMVQNGLLQLLTLLQESWSQHVF